jgi:hypothetical protein
VFGSIDDGPDVFCLFLAHLRERLLRELRPDERRLVPERLEPLRVLDEIVGDDDSPLLLLLPPDEPDPDDE